MDGTVRGICAPIATGAGKTRLILEAVKLLPPAAKVIVVLFREVAVHLGSAHENPLVALAS